MTGRGKKKRYAEWPANGLTLEHIADQPMTFRTKDDLRKHCKEKGIHAGALE